MNADSKSLSKSELDHSLTVFARLGDVEQARLCLIAGADAKDNGSAALTWAAIHGKAECVKLLIPVSDAKAHNSMALRRAAGNGHAECVELLIPASDVGDSRVLALDAAVENGHVECVKILAPLTDVRHKNFYPLQIAAARGYAECVSLLLPKSAGLLDQHGFVAEILWKGRVGIVAQLLDFKPSLLDHLDLWHCMDNACQDGNLELAIFLKALMERRSIADSAPSSGPASSVAAPRRL